MNDKDQLLKDAFGLLDRASRGEQDGYGMCNELDAWMTRAEHFDIGVRAETLARRADCARRGHPDAYPVSGPLPNVTEYKCDACDEYFLRDDP